MTRKRVVKLFTIEGSLYSILAIVFGSIYGSPIFYLLYKNGFPVPPADQKVGIAISDFIYLDSASTSLKHHSVLSRNAHS